MSEKEKFVKIDIHHISQDKEPKEVGTVMESFRVLELNIISAKFSVASASREIAS